MAEGYDLRGPRVQVAWTHGLTDFIMPYMIQTLKEMSGKVDTLMRERKEAQTAAVTDEATKKQQEAQSNAYLSLMPLALPAPPLAGGAGGPSADGFGGAAGGYSANNGTTYGGGGFGQTYAGQGF